ncbi:hypothetical protein [Bacillus sp. H1m]|uniref:hypothetical protein n=1 Tax=Bacillus sp. H1m TaxID=1397277 RepID=UPI00046A9C63|nr:hypothetical protein [Bacillus sp. H1m]
MLGILFTAAPSVDVVKDLQDKVISIQDHEISFLNGTIAIWAAGTGILVAIALAVVGFTNSRAKKNMEDANAKMLEATNKLKDAEKKISDLESKIAEANKILTEANSMANFAQEKLEELEQGQKEIRISTKRLETNNHYHIVLDKQKIEIGIVKEDLKRLPVTNSPFLIEKLHKLLTECNRLDSEFNRIKILISTEFVKGNESSNSKGEVVHFSGNVEQLMNDASALKFAILNKDTSDEYM